MEVVIDRSKWVCGNKEELGDSLLLNDTGRMCCLGHICNQHGVPEHELLGNGNPMDIEHAPDFLMDEGSNSDISEDAIRVNDNEELTQAQRESQLKKLFKGVLKLTFQGRLK